MNQQLTCLVGLVVLLMLASQSDALITSDGLEVIDDFLGPKVNGPNVETNLKTILGWLKEIRKATIPDLPKYKLVVESLNDIEELSNRIERRQCDPRSYQLRRELNAAQRQRGRAIGLSEEITWHLSSNLARSCQKEHIQTYLKRRVAERNGEGMMALLRIRPFFLRTIYANIRSDNDRITHTTFMTWVFFSHMGLANHGFNKYLDDLPMVLLSPVGGDEAQVVVVAYEMATDAAKKKREDPEFREILEGVEKNDPVLNADQAINVFKRTILADCKIYMEDFGKLIFTNAREDLDEYLDGDGILADLSMEFSIPDKADYYLDWTIHNACSEYLDNPRVMDNFSSEMVRFVDNKSTNSTSHSEVN